MKKLDVLFIIENELKRLMKEKMNMRKYLKMKLD